MNKYELTLILPAKATSAKKKTILELVEKTISLFKGKIGKVEDWGVLTMFHEIKKNKEGVYLHFPLEISSENVKHLNLKLKTENSILRYLLIKA